LEAEEEAAHVVDVRLDGITVELVGDHGQRASALRDCSLHVRSGELLVLVGPSGSGKSTLLRTIAGLETPSAGTVEIDGVVVNRQSVADRDVALVSQFDTLLSHMTVEENLGFPLRLRKVSREETAARVGAEARTLGLWAKLRRRPRQLSSGERQKAALGRATTRRPRVFLFDEPLAALDAGERERVRRELRTLQRGLGVTSIYVTHDQRDAMALGDRVAVLHRGRVAQIGEPMAVYADPADLFVARFFGSPPLGILEGPVHDDGTTAWIDVHGTAVRLQPPHRRAARTHAATRLALGLRADAVTFDRVDAADEWSRDVPLVVDRVEPMGATTVVALRPADAPRHDGSLLHTTVRPGVRVDRGDRLVTTLDLRDALLFDALTGARIATTGV
jgi:multiple sugar transport system ATP-binding protein